MSESNHTSKPTQGKKPKGYRYKVKSAGERREVEWLVRQGDFDSIEDYEDFIKNRNWQKEAG